VIGNRREEEGTGGRVGGNRMVGEREQDGGQERTGGRLRGNRREGEREQEEG
jgi:hypothetical protein